MPRIKHIVFITGGVILPTVTQATLASLNPGQQLDAGSQFILHGLEKALTTGKISPQAYCQRVIQQTGAMTNAGELIVDVLESTTLLPGMLPLIKELSEGLDLGLVSDYPDKWITPIIMRTGLGAYFPRGADQVIGEVWTKPDYIGLFRFLIEQNVLKPGSSMWVDHNSLRCMAAIRQGIDVGIFVDARRLYRDLGLWGLVPFMNRQNS